MIAPLVGESGDINSLHPPPVLPEERLWFATSSWCRLRFHFHCRHNAVPCWDTALYQLLEVGQGGSPGNTPAFLRNLTCAAHWLHHYRCVGLQYGSSPGRREKLVQGVCKVVLFFIRYSLALFMPISTFNPNWRSWIWRNILNIDVVVLWVMTPCGLVEMSMCRRKLVFTLEVEVKISP